MTAQEFSTAYSSIRLKLTDAEIKKFNKSELQDLLKTASETLQKAEETIFQQSDALLNLPMNYWSNVKL